MNFAATVARSLAVTGTTTLSIGNANPSVPLRPWPYYTKLRFGSTVTVDEALMGPVPDTVQIDHDSSSFDPLPGVSDTRYVFSFIELTANRSTLADFREAKPEELEAVRKALDGVASGDHFSLRYEAELERQAETARQYRAAFSYHQAESVVTSEVIGMANECCADAGGTFIGQRVLETFSGDRAIDLFATGGQGYYGDEQCGDRYVSALGTLVSASEEVSQAGCLGDVPASESPVTPLSLSDAGYRRKSGGSR